MDARIVLLFAGLTIRETIRRRILVVLLGLTAISVALVGWGVDRLIELSGGTAGIGQIELMLGVSQVLILIAFMFSFVLAMSGAFLAAPAIGSDVESGIALGLLARPIRRSDLLLGRWVGLTLLTAAYTALSGGLAIGVVGLVSGYVPPSPEVAVVFLILEATVVVTLALALGTRLPGIAAGAISVVAFGLAWFAGVLGGIALQFDAPALKAATDALGVIVPTDGLWRGVVFGLEPPLAILLAEGAGVGDGSPFFASSPPPLPFVAWATLWVVLVLGLGVLAFRRREV
jgi:ABC-type transport system involved in multi-copper enzyme maturation permease subunit